MSSIAIKRFYWTLLGVACVVLIAYLIYRVSDPRFRYSILDSFLATMLGVLVGVPVALGLDRFRQREEDTKRRDREHNEQIKMLTVLVDRIALELSHNIETTQKLAEALSSAGKSRTDLWEWAITIVESFSLESTDEYNRSGLREYLPSELDDGLFHSNYDLRRLHNCVTQAAKKHIFLHGYKADIEGAKAMLRELRDVNRKAEELLRKTRDSLSIWQEVER